MYLLLLGMLLTGAIIEQIAIKSENKGTLCITRILFWFSCALMLYMMLFRYGQRADYWQYRALYNEAPFNRGFPLFWYTREMHSEVGFRFLINLFTCWDCPPIVFYGFLSCIIMCATLWALHHYCKLRSLALLLIMPTLFLSYYMSGIRNGLVVAIALAVLPKLLYQHKYITYLLIVGLLSTIHISALIYLIAIPVQQLELRKLMYCVPILAMLGILIAYTPLHTLLSCLPGLARLASDEPSYMGIAERTCMMVLITFLYFYREKESIKAEYRLSDILYRIYLVGYGFSLAGLTSAYISQRITMPLKSLEVLLIPLLIIQCNKKAFSNVFVAVTCLISLVMAGKNLHFSAEDKNLFTYSYISIWDAYDESTETHMNDIRRWSTNVYNMVEEGTWVDP